MNFEDDKSMERRALIVGINHYPNFTNLNCAVEDACRMFPLLQRHADKSLNYDANLLTSGGGLEVTRALLRQELLKLFSDFRGDVLFFFSGHGASTPWGAYLVTEDATTEELGVSMEDVLILANKSDAREVVLILDCCHSGDIGNPPILQGLESDKALLREGVTIVAASRPKEAAQEFKGNGLFTGAICEGLEGGAADYLGNVSASSLFLYVDRLFGAWQQRPVYKCHSARVATLRTCIPAISPEVLRQMTDLFQTEESRIRLDPEYESVTESNEDNPQRAQKREHSRFFKQLRDSRMLQSVGNIDLYWAAMNSDEIELTQLGRYFHRLLKQGRI
jgi:Caspase domain